jgi:hypothetical protein
MKSLAKEAQTVRVMIGLYCRHHHGGTGLCDDCRNLADYAEARIRACPHGGAKPACSHCPIHCYKPEMRNKITEVMRFAGPRMTLRHPVLAIRHLAGLKGSYGRKSTSS